MIDPTTLPVVEVGETLVEGQRFTIKGKRFDRWPEELVLCYQENTAQNQPIPDFHLMKLVSRTDKELVFEYTATQTFQVSHVFNIFATPFGVPRAILEYNLIDTIG